MSESVSNEQILQAILELSRGQSKIKEDIAIIKEDIAIIKEDMAIIKKDLDDIIQKCDKNTRK